MATVIKLKRGTSTPTTSDITNGEVAVDTSAKKIYINDGGTIKTIGVGDAASSPVSVLIKDAVGTTINTRTGLNATGGATVKTEKSDGTALKTLVGPFVDALPEITTPSGNVIMDASAADTDIGDEILLESGDKVNLEHETQTT
tara:strand:- start:130 stop:561 length:432 start_codon:yes stop_codon:yes gene_type:complete